MTKKFKHDNRKRFSAALKRIKLEIAQNNIFVGSFKQHNIINAYLLHHKIIDKPLHKKDIFEFIVLLYINKDEKLTAKIPPKKRIKKVRQPHSFYDSDAWRELRILVFRKYGATCMKCKASNKEMHIDHIKPRSKYPELELVFDNPQVLCRKCNKEKSNKHETDYRPK